MAYKSTQVLFKSTPNHWRTEIPPSYEQFFLFPHYGTTAYLTQDPKRLDGKVIAEKIHEEIQAEVYALKKDHGVTPGLAVVLVGERKDSQTYVRMKKQAAEKTGMRFWLKEIPDTVQQQELLKIVQDLNADEEVHGLIIQLPLPAHIEEVEILDAVSYEKDIDGFHPLNIGKCRDLSCFFCRGTCSEFHSLLRCAHYEKEESLSSFPALQRVV